MTSLHARMIAMATASAVASEHQRALNNHNANNNTRIDGWAGV